MIIFLIIITSYLLIVFVLSRLVIPHLGFKKDSLPKNIPVGWQKEIEFLKNKANNAEEFLFLTYNYLGQKYSYKSRPFFRRFKIFPNFRTLFLGLDELYRRKGFMHCTQLNFLLCLFLINSGFFKEEDIRLKHVFVNFFIHQYAQVHLNNKWVDVDIFDYSNGLKIGEHLKTFSL